jgi:protein-S-isoprenylcysteine O-methyltransferase Ste14
MKPSYEQWRPARREAWLASIVTIMVVVTSHLLERGTNAYLRGAGIVLLVLSGVLIFVPFYFLSKHGRSESGKSYMHTRAVVDQGPYAVTRHPQYLGYMLLACGFALLSQHMLTILLAATGITLLYGQAVQEEGYCSARLGEPYERYLQRVPRFNLVLGLFRLWRRWLYAEG